MPKLTFEQALERIANDQPTRAEAISASALRRKVWLLQYSAPGCLADHSEVHTTKGAALESARMLYADDAMRGFMACLKRHHIAACDESGYMRVSINPQPLSSCF